MDRRNLMVLFGASVIGMETTSATNSHAQEGKTNTDDMHENCADACYDCSRKCTKGFRHCHGKVVGGMKLYEKATVLCNDCSEICLMVAKLVDRRSPLMSITCCACAESCEKCILECEKLNDPEMNAMVESLKKCHRLCEEMAKEMGHNHKK